MRRKWMAAAAAVALTGLAAPSAYCAADVTVPVSVINPQAAAQVAPGKSSKSDVRALFGEPWRVVQFNDCGEAMDDQADETWEYRGRDAKGSFRLHIEFDDHGVVHLVAKIPDQTPGGEGTSAKVAPSAPSSGMSM